MSERVPELLVQDLLEAIEPIRVLILLYKKHSYNYLNN